MITVGKSNFVTSATGLVDDGMPLSRVHEIKTPKVSERAAVRACGPTSCLTACPSPFS